MGCRLRSASNVSVLGECDSLVATLSGQRNALAAVAERLDSADSSVSASEQVARAHRAAHDAAEEVLAMLRAQAALVESAAEAQRDSMAQETARERVVAHGRSLMTQRVRGVSEALRSQADAVMAAQRLHEAGPRHQGTDISGVVAALRSSCPQLGKRPIFSQCPCNVVVKRFPHLPLTSHSTLSAQHRSRCRS